MSFEIKYRIETRVNVSISKTFPSTSYLKVFKYTYLLPIPQTLEHLVRHFPQRIVILWSEQLLRDAVLHLHLGFVPTVKSFEVHHRNWHQCAPDQDSVLCGEQNQRINRNRPRALLLKAGLQKLPNV